MDIMKAIGTRRLTSSQIEEGQVNFAFCGCLSSNPQTNDLTDEGIKIHGALHIRNSRLNNAFKLCQNEIAVVPDFHKRILFSDEAHFWLNGYVNKQNCRIWSEANPQVYVETPLHPEKLTVWCAFWAGGILLQKR
ncbi:uncharacterized protein TNCV_171041 [Trichonephila clavipes]|nr:uncharacterized protein TNCV_171041 [Trichonephila clavipes]